MLAAQPFHHLLREGRQCQAPRHIPCVLQPLKHTVGRRATAVHRPRLAVTPHANPLDALIFEEGYTEVEEVKGSRIVLDSEPAEVEYLIKWKDGTEDTWESPKNLSEDLVRAYEDKWWAAAKKADGEALAKMLAGGRQLLANAVDDNRRSALHFAAALGKTDVTKLLLEAGAYVDLQDREGYTPLHMAAGYMHTGSMTALLEAGASAELRDNTGKSTIALIDKLRKEMPLTAGTVTRRLALEGVNNCLVDRMYEEVVPLQILDVRTRDVPAASTSGPPPPPSREFLIQFSDGSEDEWVEERNISPSVIADWEAGLEYATALEVLDVAQVGTERRFKIRWSDDYPVSWEPEEYVPQQLIKLFQRQSPERFEERTRPENSAGVSGTWAQEYETQYRVGAAGKPRTEGSNNGRYAAMQKPSAMKQQQQQKEKDKNGTGGDGGSTGGHGGEASSHAESHSNGARAADESAQQVKEAVGAS